MNETVKPVYRIADMPVNERPRERLERIGADMLKTEELLAILLRVGLEGENAVELGLRLLLTYKSLNGLHRASFAELCSERGIGRAKAAQIKAALELGHRLKEEDLKERPAINSPDDAVALIQFDMSGLEQEHLRVMLLDTRNRVLDTVEVYKGSVNSSQVQTGEVFKPAIRRNATSIIVIHNHPSGDPTPSPDDIAVTREIFQAGKLLGIEVLDHLIIGQGKNSWVSLKTKGLGYG